jgi:AcrR family transcriptional regulator
MARPLSDDRRASLLEAAMQVIAEHGLSAPTSLISRTANVSEGSFFTYFKTKDELINALYREIRLDLAAAVMRDFPRSRACRTGSSISGATGCPRASKIPWRDAR